VLPEAKGIPEIIPGAVSMTHSRRARCADALAMRAAAALQGSSQAKGGG
jgi:hypothetical protein